MRIEEAGDRKVIISVAPVAAEAVEGVKNPLTPEEVAQDTIAAAEAGASMVHLHVRDRVGKLTDDLTEFSRTADFAIVPPSLGATDCLARPTAGPCFMVAAPTDSTSSASSPCHPVAGHGCRWGF